MKKLLTIFIILFLGSVFALGVYNFIILPHQADINRPPESRESKKEKTDTGIQANNIFSISKKAVVGPVISADKAHIVYYLKSNGNVVKTGLDGQNSKAISQYLISNITNIEWSPQKDMVVCSRVEGNQEVNYIYNYADAKKYDLKPNMREIHFSPNNNKIVYSFLDSTNINNISIADSNGDNWNVILSTRLLNPKIQWIDNLKIAIYEHPSYKNSSSILIADTSDAHLDRILSGHYGLAARFSLDGKKIIYSYSDREGKKINLSFYDVSAKKEIKTKIETFAEKCVWSMNNKDVFCAVPTSLPYSNLPDQFYESNFSSADSIAKIDSETGGIKTAITLPEIDSSGIDARNLFLSPTEDRLYFINHNDEKLYGVNL